MILKFKLINNFFFRLFDGNKSKDKKIKKWNKELFNFLEKMGKDPEADIHVNELDNGDIIIRKGYILVSIGFIPGEDDNTYINIISPLVYLPQHNFVAIYRRLLDINDSLNQSSGKFSTHDDYVKLEFSLNIKYLSIELIEYTVLNIIDEALSIKAELREEFEVLPYDIWN